MPLPSSPSSLKDYGRYGTVGLEIIIALGVGYYGGSWLDGRFAGGHGYLTAVGVAFGVLTAIRNLIVVTHDMQRATALAEEEDRKNGVVLPTFPKKNDHDDDEPRAD